jgi:hypothetical protein
LAFIAGPPVLGLPIELCGAIDWLSLPAAPMSELALGPGLAAGAVAEVSAVVPVLACCSIANRSRGEAFMYWSSWA